MQTVCTETTCMLMIHLAFVTVSDFCFCFISSETKKMQQMSLLNIQRILREKERLSDELEKKMDQLQIWSKTLDKKEALTELERQKLDQDKKKAILLVITVHRKQSVCAYVCIYVFFSRYQ